MKNFIQENFRGGGHMIGSGGHMISPMTGGRRMIGDGRISGGGDMRMRLFRPQKPGISSYNRGFLYPQRHFRYKPYFYGGLYYYPYRRIMVCRKTRKAPIELSMDNPVLSCINIADADFYMESPEESRDCYALDACECYKCC